MGELKRKHTVLFISSLVCSVISSLSLLAAILVNSEGKNKEILIAFGLVFWIGLILEQVLFWRANRLMRIAITKDRRRIRGKPGIISLSTYIEGLVVDAVFIISLIAFVVCTAFSLGESLMQYVLICLMVLSFRLHCFLNGRNYKYKKLKERKVDRKNG